MFISFKKDNDIFLALHVICIKWIISIVVIDSRETLGNAGPFQEFFSLKMDVLIFT